MNIICSGSLNIVHWETHLHLTVHNSLFRQNKSKTYINKHLWQDNETKLYLHLKSIYQSMFIMNKTAVLSFSGYSIMWPQLIYNNTASQSLKSYFLLLIFILFPLWLLCNQLLFKLGDFQKVCGNLFVLYFKEGVIFHFFMTRMFRLLPMSCMVPQ